MGYETLVEALKHLPGQHDQKSHAGGKGGGGEESGIPDNMDTKYGNVIPLTSVDKLGGVVKKLAGKNDVASMEYFVEGKGWYPNPLGKHGKYRQTRAESIQWTVDGAKEAFDKNGATAVRVTVTQGRMGVTELVVDPSGNWGESPYRHAKPFVYPEKKTKWPHKR